jgi:hypothetical protein
MHSPCATLGDGSHARTQHEITLAQHVIAQTRQRHERRARTHRRASGRAGCPSSPPPAAAPAAPRSATAATPAAPNSRGGCTRTQRSARSCAPCRRRARGGVPRVARLQDVASLGNNLHVACAQLRTVPSTCAWRGAAPARLDETWRTRKAVTNHACLRPWWPPAAGRTLSAEITEQGRARTRAPLRRAAHGLVAEHSVRRRRQPEVEHLREERVLPLRAPLQVVLVEQAAQQRLARRAARRGAAVSGRASQGAVVCVARSVVGALACKRHGERARISCD